MRLTPEEIRALPDTQKAFEAIRPTSFQQFSSPSDAIPIEPAESPPHP
jgi:hypothetical protein